MKPWEIAERIYCFISPYEIVGPYQIRRCYDYFFRQGIADYDFRGIDKDSVVLDLGACVGGFAIHASRICKHVYAVEPLFTSILEENLRMNKISNCTVLPFAVGEFREDKLLEFQGVKKLVEFHTFDEIISMVPEQVTFLKCDIEGSEKYVPFDRFQDIEAEIHDFEKMVFKQYHKRNGVEVEILR